MQRKARHQLEFLIDIDTPHPSQSLKPFLIDSLPIKIQPNPNALNEIFVSNRGKKESFHLPATCNLKPATCLSNRNCKELKIDVTA
ncbi:MAG TPA: hypothetical protein VJS43_01280 [Candidatus Acidoferrales bacterium]|nr:hypothetical protein [Candidatus Acidoferrales bacterium]